MKTILLKKLVLVLLALALNFTLKAQCTISQLGIDMNGEADNDQSGYSVSLSADGLTVAIGGRFNAGGGTQRGHVRIYKNIMGTWTQQGADINGEADSDFSGWSVSLSSDGSIVAIGAIGNASFRGHVRVYKNIMGTWTQQGLDIDGESNSDQSGLSVSLSSDGSTVAIGSRINAGGGSNRGHVRVYKNISNTWIQQGLDIDGEADSDFSGWSVSLSSDGSTVAIGAINNDGNGSNSGHVRIYKNIMGTWTQQGADINGEADNDQSGYSVSLSADGLTVAIGANNNAGGGTLRGHVRIYKNIMGTWTQQGIDIDGEGNDDRSGHSVSLSADGLTVAIGAYNNDENGSNSGHVRIYKNIMGTWTQQGADINGEASNDLSGWSVSISADGGVVAIGAVNNAGGGNSRGHARVYSLSCPAASLNFDGVNDYVSIPTLNMSSGNTMTIEAWIKPSDITTNTYYEITRQQGGGLDWLFSFQDNGTILSFGLQTSTGYNELDVTITASDFTDGNWHHVAAVYDGANRRIYKDGVLIGSDAKTGNITFNGTINNIGAYNGAGEFFNGDIDEVRFWNKALSLTEITTKMNCELLGTETNLAAYYKFNQGFDNFDNSATTALLDATANANNGTLTNMNLTGTTSNWVAPGAVTTGISCTPPCSISSALPTAAGTYTSTQTAAAGAYTCYCNALGNLLLALDTNGTGAVIPASGVSLQIGSTTTTAWNDAGGIIGNPNGGAIFNRKWNVTPTVQPTSPVKVKYFFTQVEYDSIAARLLALGTTIGNVANLEMYKLSSNGFDDPHASAATGIILANGALPSLSQWMYSVAGTDHCAEFLVSSFSGGGGGFGAGGAPLPVEFISFTAKGLNQTSALLKWQTAQEVNNSHFEIERSLDGMNFSKIGAVNANGTNAGNYQFIDKTIAIGTPKAFYRIKQVDVNGASKSTQIQLVNFGLNQSNVVIYPNPLNSELNLEMTLALGETANITITDMMGKTTYQSAVSSSKTSLDLSTLSNGVYTISIQHNGVVEHYKIIKQ